MRSRRLVLTAVLGTALVAGACGGSDGNPASPSPQPGTSTPTFSTISSQILVPRCTGCHGGGAPSAGLNLEANAAYAALVNVASSQKSGAVRVIPGNPDGSYLVQKLRGDAGIVGLRMPRNGPPYLSDDQVNLIRQWIQAGARND